VEITFVRHAESEANGAGRWQGQGDSPLSDRGREQARMLGRRLSAHPFDLVVCSDLGRACATAEALGVPVEPDPGWREVDVGRWEGLTRQEVATAYPEEMRAIAAGEPVAMGGGESWVDMHARVDAALERLLGRLDADARVLVVSHGGTIGGVLAGMLDSRERRPWAFGRATNTALSTIRIGNGLAEILRFNDAAHIGPIGPWLSDRITAGAPVGTLVAHGPTARPTEPSEPTAGRSRGDPWALGLERLAAWYSPPDSLWATADPAARLAGAVLSTRHGVPLMDQALEAHALTRHVATHHTRGGRCAVVIDGESISRWATGALEGPNPRARLAPLAHAALSHFVLDGEDPVLADYNVAPL